MSFDWTEYLKFAKKIMGGNENPIPEAEQRAAISRAYYSAYCTACEYLKQNDPTFESRMESAQMGNHTFVIQEFQRLGQIDPVLRNVSNNLYDMRKYRVEVDYYENPSPERPSSESYESLAHKTNAKADSVLAYLI